MNTRDDKLDRLEQALIRAHGETRAPDPGDLFTDAVMARIRSDEGTANDVPPDADTIWDKILLPFACSCAGAAVILAVLGWSAYQGLDMDLLGSAYADTSSMLTTWTGTF